MSKRMQHQRLIIGIHRGVAGAALSLAIVLVAAVVATGSAQAQSYTPYVYSFPGTPGGAYPAGAGLVLDTSSGYLYGTTYYGGTQLCNGSGGCGTVFKIDTNLNPASVLYSFPMYAGDGEYPYAGVVLDGSGNLYGTTVQGGTYGAGTVFKLGTSEQVLHSFPRTAGDGAYPYAGVVLDGSGNLYGTTELAGDLACNGGNGCGTVFKVDTSNHETVLHRFTGTWGDGRTLYSEGVVLDGKGNLYGATSGGGDYTNCQSFGCGTVFKINTTYTGTTLMALNETVLYRFTGTGGDGLEPVASLVQDANGNLYGTTTWGGLYDHGTVFMVNPTTHTEAVLYSFQGGADGRWPQSSLVWDGNGNLYGTTYLGGNLACHPGYGCGTVFELSPEVQGSCPSGSNPGNGWCETALYSFNGTPDGAFPVSSLVLDGNGNLYGTTSGGGTYGNGTVFKLTP